jgi:hypothetical protein
MELHHRVRLQTALHVVKDLAGPVTVPQEELEQESTHKKRTPIQLFGTPEAYIIAVKLQRIGFRGPK